MIIALIIKIDLGMTMMVLIIMIDTDNASDDTNDKH